MPSRAHAVRFHTEGFTGIQCSLFGPKTGGPANQAPAITVAIAGYVTDLPVRDDGLR